MANMEGMENQNQMALDDSRNRCSSIWDVEVSSLFIPPKNFNVKEPIKEAPVETKTAFKRLMSLFKYFTTPIKLRQDCSSESRDEKRALGQKETTDSAGKHESLHDNQSPQPNFNLNREEHQNLHQRFLKKMSSSMLKESFSFSAIKEKAKHVLPRSKKAAEAAAMLDMTPLAEQLPNPLHVEDLTPRQRKRIESWVGGTIDSDPKEYTLNANHVFNALTTAQLIKLRGAMIDSMEVFTRYHVPNSTPNSEREESDRLHGLRELEEEQTRRYRRKDLATYFGVPTHGLHILFDGIPDEAYDDPSNMSDYYDLPLIENPQHIQTKFADIIYRDDDRDYDSDGCSTYDQEQNYFLTVKENNSPAESIILYLRGTGMSIAAITDKMLQLDPAFLFECHFHVTKGIRFKYHTQIKEHDLKVYWEVAKNPSPEQWELPGAKDPQGKVYPKSYRDMKMRQTRTKRLSGMVKNVIENHLYYRMKHQTLHIPAVPPPSAPTSSRTTGSGSGKVRRDPGGWFSHFPKE